MYINKCLHLLVMYFYFVITAAQRGSRGFELRRTGFNCTTIHVISGVNVIVGVLQCSHVNYTSTSSPYSPVTCSVDSHTLQKGRKRIYIP